MNRIENNTVKLVSGFGGGEWVSKWNGDKFVEIARVGEDQDSKEILLEPNFKGAVGEFHEVSSLTSQTSVVLVGFADEEINAPSPVQGWNMVGSGFTAEKCEVIKCFGDYLAALANNSFVAIPEGGEIHPVSGNRLVKLPYEWGSQAAAHYAIISPEGEIVREERDCGDLTPYPLKTDGSTDWEFSSPLSDVHRKTGLSKQKCWFLDWEMFKIWYRNFFIYKYIL